MICKILALFVNTLTAGDKYSVLNRGNLLQRFQMQSSQKQKTFSQIFFFFFHFRNLDSILNIFQKRMTLIADVFLNLRTPKTWLDKYLKSPFSEDPLTSNVVNGLKHGWSERKHLHHIYWSLWKEFRWRKCILVICKMLGVLANALTANDKYSLLNRDNL